MANEESAVRSALARAIAERQVPDDVVDLAAKQIANYKHPIRGIDVCTVGICIDYIVEAKDWESVLPDIISIPNGKLEKIEVFPWGIVQPDLFQVKVSQDLDLIPRSRL